jgi:hypothetical protein
VRRRAWDVFIDGVEHHVEVSDMNRPLLAYVDGTPVAIDWQGADIARLDIGGHPGLLEMRSEHSPWAWVLWPLAALLGLGSSPGTRMRPRLIVELGNVARVRSR